MVIGVKGGGSDPKHGDAVGPAFPLPPQGSVFHSLGPVAPGDDDADAVPVKHVGGGTKNAVASVTNAAPFSHGHGTPANGEATPAHLDAATDMRTPTRPRRGHSITARS